jgi:glycosyltransferase involved in cell wall biosynthesis
VRELYPQKKIFAICHGSDLRQMKKNSWQVEYIQSQIKKLDGIWALHKEQKLDIMDTYSCREEQVTVIGTGYNKEVFYKQDEGHMNHKTRLIFAGKISEKKGVMSMLRALSHLENVMERYELVLAGGAGNQKEFEEIRQMAEACSCDVFFLGKLSHQELAKEMNQSDIFVLPSFFEGLPLVVIEAMACGLHVVCTDLPGIQPWLDEALPNHCVTFVEPPRMKNADEPLEEDLAEFERKLAFAIETAKQKSKPKDSDLEKLSWDGLCQTCVQMF